MLFLRRNHFYIGRYVIYKAHKSNNDERLRLMFVFAIIKLLVNSW